ncbi:MAG: glycosyltransferase family 2 protein [Candidatus Micrarchaeaceae archaeon]
MNKRNIPLISVIIPTMDRPKMLKRCIKSVIAGSYKNLEIIVTDDSELDRSKLVTDKLRKEFKDLIYIHNNERSVSVAINRAVKQSKGEYIFILDDDNAIDKDCIKWLVHSISKNNDVGIVGPLALYYSNKNIIMHAGTIRSRFMRRAIYPHQNEKWIGQINEGEEVEDFANAFMFKKAAAKKAGLWDLLVPHMGEDGDFEARVRKMGYKVIINPKAKTYHDIPYNPKEPYFLRISERRMYHSMHSKVLYVFRYDNMQQKITFALSIPIYLGFYIKAVIKDKNSKNNKLKLLKSLLKGTLDGFADAIKKRSKIEYL